MLFHNLYILDSDIFKNQLEEMLIERLKDEQVEVGIQKNNTSHNYRRNNLTV